MRAYRALWGTVLALAAVSALCVGGATLGWLALLGTSALLAVLGAVVGFGWTEGRFDWRTIRTSAGWFGLMGILAMGLPTLLGGWTLLALLGLAATSPQVLEAVSRAHQRRRPALTGEHAERMTERELERRWHRTSAELHRRSLPAAEALRIVQERQLLLDEMERRDPEGFERQLVRAGWHSSGSTVE